MILHLQERYGYPRDGAEEIDDDDYHFDLPLEVILHEDLAPTNSSNARSVIKSFACDQCDKSFTTRYALNAHKTSVHLGTTYLCDICNKSFTLPHNLIRHKNTIHQKYAYACALCQLSFGSPSKLKTHEIVMHQKGKRSFHCKICGKSFDSARYFKIHLAAHAKL